MCFLEKWLYTAVVRPMVMYGAPVWAYRVPVGCRPLLRLQRLALMLMGSFKKSTPTAGLEAILEIQPVDLFAKQEATLAVKRIGG